MRVVKLKIGLLSIVAGAVISSGLMPGITTPTADAVPFQVDAVKTEYLDKPITVNGGDQKILMFLRDISLRDLLKTLSKRAGFNILLDDSVSGSISVDLNNITINEALECIKDYSNLVYMQDDKTLIVSGKDSALSESINQQITQMIPVKYVNAKLISDILNNTVFKQEGTVDKRVASAEFRTNSVVIVGTDNDIRLAEDFIKKIDSPRESKTFKINHASVYDVTQLLQASVFNDGVSPFGGSGGSGNAKTQATAVQVNVETFEEGSGSQEVQGASGEGGGDAQTFTLRTTQLTQKELKISPEGPMLVPDSRTNTLTIMGTVEQIALAEAVIPTLDQKLPQVAIEASLIEIEENYARELNAVWGQQGDRFRTGFNNTTVSTTQAGSPNAAPQRDTSFVDSNGVVQTVKNGIGTFGNVIGLPTVSSNGRVGSAISFSTLPIDRTVDFIYQLNTMLAKQKGKLLANPTVIAVHNTEAVVSITEEVIRRTTVTRDATGFTQIQVEIGEAGIILNILPKITGDGFVNMRIRPSVSTIGDIVQNGEDIVTLLRRKDFSVQEARVANGQTLALGGLIEERASKTHSKVPGLGDLPIVGALFRANSRGKTRSELLMLITPRLLDDETPLISSSFDVEPAVKISSDDEISKEEARKDAAPVPTQEVAQEKKVAEVQPLSDAHEFKPVDIEDSKYEIKQVESESSVNAYTVDSVMQELGIDNLGVDVKNKKYDRSQIDELLNEYLPQGSK